MKFKALTPIDYNNERYDIGETIDVSEKHVKALLEAKGIEPLVEKDDDKKAPKK